jgi:hypothetical protein
LIVVDYNMFQFDWYREKLAEEHPRLVHLEHDDVPGFIEINLRLRSICTLSLADPQEIICTSSKYSFVNTEY